MQKNNTNKFDYQILGFSFCKVTVRKPFAWSMLHGFVSHRFFAQIFCTDFCTDFLHGLCARIFCTVFLHGFFARIFCIDVCFSRFFCRFFAQISAQFFTRFFCTDVCTDFLHEFFGVCQNTCWATSKFHPDNFIENSPFFGGLLGEGGL